MSLDITLVETPKPAEESCGMCNALNPCKGAWFVGEPVQCRQCEELGEFKVYETPSKGVFWLLLPKD